MQIFDDLYEVGGVRSKLPDGSGPDRTPLSPRTPHGRGRPFPITKSTTRTHQKEMAFSRRNFGDLDWLDHLLLRPYPIRLKLTIARGSLP
jgi:hypothetical protein